MHVIVGTIITYIVHSCIHHIFPNWNLTMLISSVIIIWHLHLWLFNGCFLNYLIDKPLYIKFGIIEEADQFNFQASPLYKFIKKFI